MPLPEVAFYDASSYIIFGETPEYDEEKYIYEVSGRDLLCIYATNMNQGWTGHCTLQDLKETMSDISPDEDQMLDWIVTAAESNQFSLVRDEGHAHLKAQIKAGGFTIDIRLPPGEDLQHARDDTEPQNFDGHVFELRAQDWQPKFTTLLATQQGDPSVFQDLAYHLLKQHQQQDKALARKTTESQESHAKVKELQEQVHQLESRLSTVQLALRQAKAKGTSQSQQFTASMSSIDAMSPTQSLQASQGTHGGHKKARSEQTQAVSGHSLPAQDSTVAGTVDSGNATQSGSDHAASQSGQASHQSEPQSKQGSDMEAEAEVSEATAPRVGQAKVVTRGRGHGRGRGRQAIKIGG